MSPTSTPISPNASTLHLEIVAHSDVGQERELNEDTVWAAPLSPGAENAWQLAGLLVVADGMGGHQAGEVASSLAGQTVRQIFTAPRPAFAPEALTGQGLLAGLSNAVEEVNRAVYAAGETGAATGGRPGTTLTVALLRADEWAIGHVGDSRAYLIRRNEVEQLTNDDSLVAEAVRRGQMTEAEAQSSQFRNQITKAIGLNADVTPSTYQGSWAAGDVILLCSDGLTEYVQPAEMLDAIAGGDSLERACQTLIDLANKRGGHDNISVAAARFVPGLNGKGAAPMNGNGRKPATWPPIERAGIASAADPFVDENPTRKRGKAQSSSKLPWIAAASLIAVVLAALGFWIGKRLVRPAEKMATNTITVPLPDSAPLPEKSKSLDNVSGNSAPNRAAVPEIAAKSDVSVWPNNGWKSLGVQGKKLEISMPASNHRVDIDQSSNEFKVFAPDLSQMKRAIGSGRSIFTCREGGSTGIVVGKSGTDGRLILNGLHKQGFYSVHFEKAGRLYSADENRPEIFNFRVMARKAD